MKDFDKARLSRPGRSVEERTFVLGGETFVGREVFRPDVLIPLEALKEAKKDRTTCECQHRLHEHPAGPCTAVGCTCQKMDPVIVEPGSTLADQLHAFDAAIEGMIEPGAGAVDRYRALRRRDDDPLQAEDLAEVVKWLAAGDTDRPTGQPDASLHGLGQTGAPSTDGSSSPVTQAA